jgi:hypothetical protein
MEGLTKNTKAKNKTNRHAKTNEQENKKESAERKKKKHDPTTAASDRVKCRNCREQPKA